MHAVSYTARWMAAARALESGREDALFTDPLAHALAEPGGAGMIERYAGGGLLPFISIRTRFLDDTIGDLLTDGSLRQVVLLAAGMDARAFRLSWPGGTELYEIDHAPLVEEKRHRLAALGARAAVQRHEVAADLAGAWLPELERAGFDRSRPALWVAEALTFFLTEEQAGGLLRQVASASAPGSHLALDLLGEGLLRNPFSRSFLDLLAADGTPWLFGTDEPEAFLASHGWDVVRLREPGQPGAGEGRWPYRVQPRGRRHANRLWLVRARLGER